MRTALLFVAPILLTLLSSVDAMRAWQCSGKNQKELVNKLQQANIVVHDMVARVMEMVDRKYFCPNNPHDDAPQSIGWGQTISAPHMHAYVLEEMLASLQWSSSPTFNILDVGVGSGYLAACLGQWVHPPNPMLGKTGKVHGIDVWPGLIEKCKRNLDSYNPDLSIKGTVQIALGDGWKGIKGESFDAIHVGAAAKEFPRDLMMQLKVGGIMIVPIGREGGAQSLFRIHEVNEAPQFDPENFVVQEMLGVRYVPLIHPEDI
ncbi:Protein-L-isoaspartate(D-aspartate) O-methyltransferase (PCMT) [Fragilaria crotonensis]|nr:Protein-L-isoaspartate(D-aspartate) O-methyltransferase (PCMT) [Fragilaria crotonensis]